MSQLENISNSKVTSLASGAYLGNYLLLALFVVLQQASGLFIYKIGGGPASYIVLIGHYVAIAVLGAALLRLILSSLISGYRITLADMRNVDWPFYWRYVLLYTATLGAWVVSVVVYVVISRLVHVPDQGLFQSVIVNLTQIVLNSAIVSYGGVSLVAFVIGADREHYFLRGRLAFGYCFPRMAVLTGFAFAGVYLVFAGLKPLGVVVEPPAYIAGQITLGSVSYYLYQFLLTIVYCLTAAVLLKSFLFAEIKLIKQGRATDWGRRTL